MALSVRAAQLLAPTRGRSGPRKRSKPALARLEERLCGRRRPARERNNCNGVDEPLSCTLSPRLTASSTNVLRRTPPTHDARKLKVGARPFDFVEAGASSEELVLPIVTYSPDRSRQRPFLRTGYFVLALDARDLRRVQWRRDDNDEPLGRAAALTSARTRHVSIS